MGPSDGACLLCGELESCDHIFFVCLLAKFMWACVRELLGTAWNPAGAGDFIAICQGLSGQLRCVVWFTFAAQCWALWTVRNKLVFEGRVINKPADVMLHMMIFLQRWWVLTRRRDRGLLHAARETVKRLHARLAT
jgi:hypothetical protein